ncbi:hypothetical protein EMPS_11522 [Entomortierella parvispora]|uniref:Arrestin C-terminal-like domain-containing protein n=1 Tax=Entomortierella parvispora TaxID=205924 RepID=A0A9P3M2D1_9FUNG|nr:hypothetical protein EMPS_11522 [Entomortierella parvispora]
MKRINIALLDTPASHYLPGDTLGGHVHLTTTSDFKYTCVKILFVGIVTTKVAKIEESTYVLNQQLVLLGHANNATEFILEEGKYSWPFQFTVPFQQLPSSGKYRHCTVKYSLTATVVTLGALGGVQDIQTSQSLQIKDLVNIQVEPLNTYLSITGSSSVVPGSKEKKNLATATVKLLRSGFLRGQILHVEIDLTHPYKIRRSPGCFIQLICKERYVAGDQAKEYSETVASRAETLAVSSSYSTGKIITDLTIPSSAFPTLTGSKALSIEYSLQILFDMRAKTGFMERKSKKVVTSKLRNKLLSCPGGFEVEIPIVIGTLSDSFHTQKPSPFGVGQAVAEFQIGSGGSAIPSVNNSRSDTSLTTSLSMPSSSPSPTTPASSMRLIASPIRPSDSAAHGSSSMAFLEQSSSATESPRYSMVVQLNQTSISDHNDAGTVTTIRARSATSPGNSSPASPTGVLPYYSPPPLAEMSHRQLPLIYESMSKPLPKIPTMLPTPSARRASAISMPGNPPSTEATAPVFPPRLPPRPAEPFAPASLEAASSSSTTTSSSRYIPHNTNEYPGEKEQRALQLAPIQLPLRFTVEAPTAPEAINLGLGPASPLEHPQHVNLTPRLTSPSSTQDSWTPHGGSEGSRIMGYFPPQIATAVVQSPVSERDVDMVAKSGVEPFPKSLTEGQIHSPEAPMEPAPDSRRLHYAQPSASAPAPSDSP